MSVTFNDKVYMSICSEKTLQSNQQGFFLTFADHVSDIAGERLINNVFGKLKSDRERIKFVYENEKISPVVCEVLSNVQEVFRKKNAQVSQAKRAEAERTLKSGDNLKSIMLFSQSVLRAPLTGENKKVDNGLSLVLALMGRAKSLIADKKYDLALVDVQLALKEGLTNALKAEAYWRMAICYKALGEENKSKVSFKLAEKLICEENQIRLLHEDMEKSFKFENKITRKYQPEVTGKPHTQFPCASDKINVKQTDNLGRFVIANEKISTGDTLVVEPPYAACLLPEAFGANCHNCFERLVSPLGCPDCSSVAFCKPDCRNEAILTYHKYECKFVDLLIGSGMSILSHTALRMITQNSFEKCLEMYKNRSKEKIHSLCTNAHLRSSQDFLQRTLMAAFLLRCLQKSGYFGDNLKNVIPTENEYIVGELLLFYLQILQFNAHEIYETRHTSEHRFRESKAAYIGVAVYPTVSLFNHDCYPAVTRYFHGKNIVINAARPLGKGEVIAENYGPIFTRKPLAERQRSLSSRYWFKCECLACTFDWPSINTGLEKVSKRVRCTTKNCKNIFTLPITKSSVVCPKCNKEVNLLDHVKKLEWCEEQYKLGFETMDLLEPEKAIKILCPAIEMFHRVSCPPHKETHLAQETLRACLADSGNISESLVKKIK